MTSALSGTDTREPGDPDSRQAILDSLTDTQRALAERLCPKLLEYHHGRCLARQEGGFNLRHPTPSWTEIALDPVLSAAAYRLALLEVSSVDSLVVEVTCELVVGLADLLCRPGAEPTASPAS